MDSRKRAIMAFIILLSKSKHAVGIYEKTKSEYFNIVRVGPADSPTIRILDADCISNIHGNMPLFFDSLTYSYFKITRKSDGRYVCFDSHSNIYAAALKNLDTIVVYDMQLRKTFVYSPKTDKDDSQTINDKVLTNSREYV